MKKALLLFLLYMSVTIAQNQPKIMVHYMPWFEAPPTSSNWGWHWTMNKFDPNKVTNGEREIASHFYPLTGPYDSADKLILEYQTLLMKISGIDGVLVDWYGIQNFLDYGMINSKTRALFSAIEKAGLQFGIVYEDATIQRMIAGNVFKGAEAVSHGKSVMKYMQDNWFSKDAYIKIGGRPLLLNFGPQYFSRSADWDSMFTVLPVKPAFFTLNNRVAPAAMGAYPWPPMHLSVNGTLSQTSLKNYLNEFYNRAASFSYIVTSAFPGFKDIYKQAGGTSYGFLDSQYGNTFKSTFQQAYSHNPAVIQIVTWNDYGEGTIVEPTVEFKYRYLEILQAKRDSVDAAFVFEKPDLELPLKLYNLRQQYKANKEVYSALDRVYNYIISADRNEAISLMDSIESITGVQDEPIEPREFYLNQNYPNPFNPFTNFEYSIASYGNVSLKIYDTLGNEIATIVDEEKPAGNYQAVFNSSGISSGVYYAKLQSNGNQVVKKIVLLK